MLRAYVVALDTTGLLTASSLIFAAATYPILSFTDGWCDEALTTMDGFLGFRWLFWWGLSQSYPAISDVLLYSYRSITLQPELILWVLCCRYKFSEAYRLIAGIMITLFIVDGLLYLTPAKSAAVNVLGMSDPELLFASYVHIGIIDELRRGDYDLVRLDNLFGLITFPSFHAAASALYIWRARSVVWLRIPALMINIAMLASSITQGRHYLIDAIGGVFIAMVAICATTRFKLAEGSAAAVQSCYAATGQTEDLSWRARSLA